MLTVTLDTNVIQEWWRDQTKASVVNGLLELARDGQLDLAITNRIGADIPDPPLSTRIGELPALDVDEIGTVFRLGVSNLGGGDTLVDEEFRNRLVEILNDYQQSVNKAPDWRDQDHLYGHYKAGREVFLTWDRGILKIAGPLKDKLGLVAKTPEELLNCQLRSDQI